MKDMVTISRSEYTALLTTVEQLKAQLAWFQRQVFGPKSERFIPNDSQMSLDLGVETTPAILEQEDISYTRTKVRKQAGHGRGAMPTHLPFKDVIIEPEQDTEGMEYIGDEVSWEYDLKPSSLFVRRYIRRKYAKADNSGIAIARLPARPTDKGNFGPGLMSAVAIDKYLYHQPLYRQAQRYQREFSVKFAESTLCDSITRAVFWAETIYREAKSDLLRGSYVQADETHIPVLVEGKKGKTHKGYYWVYFDPLRRIVIFEYRHGRSSEGPNDFLRTFKGIVQCDGYAGYNALCKRIDISRVGCMAHCRRKFEDALKYDRRRAEHALKIIGAWFEHERSAKENALDFEARAAMRQESIAESMGQFRQWMFEQINEDFPSSPIRKACEYAIREWDGFKTYLKDGRVELSNNWVENAVRPVALGRKNYLFKGSEEAARRGAILYSVIATAKLHGHDPAKYLKTILELLPEMKANQVQKLLPYNLCADEDNT